MNLGINTRNRNKSLQYNKDLEPQNSGLASRKRKLKEEFLFNVSTAC